MTEDFWCKTPPIRPIKRNYHGIFYPKNSPSFLLTDLVRGRGGVRSTYVPATHYVRHLHWLYQNYFSAHSEYLGGTTVLGTLNEPNSALDPHPLYLVVALTPAVVRKYKVISSENFT